jgi:hypothetical protein
MEEADWSDFMSAMLTSGVLDRGAASVGGHQQNLEPYTLTDGRQIYVAPGKAHVHGKFYRSTATKTVALAANSSGSTRVDRVVVRSNENGTTSGGVAAHTAELYVIQGTPGAGAPATSNGAGGIYDVLVATVTLSNGYTTVSSGNLSDTRVWAQLVPNSSSGTVETTNQLAVGSNSVGATGTAIKIGDFGSTTGGAVKVLSSTTNANLTLQAKGTATGTTSAVLFQDGTGATSAYFSSPSGISSDDTTLVIGRQQASTFQLQRVTEGAVDSGGIGYRVLRVPN